MCGRPGPRLGGPSSGGSRRGTTRPGCTQRWATARPSRPKPTGTPVEAKPHSHLSVEPGQPQSLARAHLADVNGSEAYRQYQLFTDVLMAEVGRIPSPHLRSMVQNAILQ